ncbi:hypothetical protein AMTRI_Chr10g4620 [Amborella trichopoda]
MEGAAYFYSSSVWFTAGDPLPRTKHQIPIQSSIEEGAIPIHVHLNIASIHAAASKIQASYRGHVARSQLKTIVAVNSEADKCTALMQRQETVDRVRVDERERVRLNERLMALLLRLDEVHTHFPEIRELRRRVSRRIVGLLEILDAVSGEEIEFSGHFPASWSEFVKEFEEKAEEGFGESCEG